MNIDTRKRALRSPPKTLKVGQAIRNSVAFVAFSPSLRGKLLQRQARRVIELFKEA